MIETTVNGVMLNERISKKLASLQYGYAKSIADGLDDAIGYILEEIGCEYKNPKALVETLTTLHNARTELLGLIPDKEGGNK